MTYPTFSCVGTGRNCICFMPSGNRTCLSKTFYIVATIFQDTVAVWTCLKGGWGIGFSRLLGSVFRLGRTRCYPWYLAMLCARCQVFVQELRWRLEWTPTASGWRFYCPRCKQSLSGERCLTSRPVFFFEGDVSWNVYVRRIGLLMNFGGFCPTTTDKPQPLCLHSKGPRSWCALSPPARIPRAPRSWAAPASLLAFREPLRKCAPSGPARIPGFPGTARCDHRDFLTIVACCVNL